MRAVPGQGEEREASGGLEPPPAEAGPLPPAQATLLLRPRLGIAYRRRGLTVQVCVKVDS